MIEIEGPRFVDEHGRTLLLRGVNLGGSSKLPLHPDGATHLSEGFLEHRSPSFVGRPFPLSEADEHFSRLRSWGFTFLRFLVTWEGVEHAGPGLYDSAYLDYLEAVARKAGEHGISLLIDPHQDVWSRFFGGDGAPGWTLEAVGIDPARVHQTGSAVLHQYYNGTFPHLLWPTNGARFGASTMFTLFFAGDLFAPSLLIDGEPAQRFLQRHYFAAVAQIASRLRGCGNVVGFDVMNEPLHGYAGLGDLRRLEGSLKMGDSPSPYQSMLLASGFSQTVPVYEMGLAGARMVGRRTVNAEGARLWKDDRECIWRRQGVWEIGPGGAPRLLRSDYFATAAGRALDFDRDCYRPFVERYARAIRAANPKALIFVEPIVGHLPPRWDSKEIDRLAYAPHWYDPLTIVRRRFYPRIAYNPLRRRFVFGRGAVRRDVEGQMAQLQHDAKERLDGAPVILGETGIPFDLDEGRAYRSGDFTDQLSAVDRIMRGVEARLLSCTWWNYTSDNDNLRGDHWNGEDFSIFSRDSGGRGLEAVVRPYARATAGEPLSMRFDRNNGRFIFVFRHDPRLAVETEIFIPLDRYPSGARISVSDGSWVLDGQLLRYRHAEMREVHMIVVERRELTTPLPHSILGAKKRIRSTGSGGAG